MNNELDMITDGIAKLSNAVFKENKAIDELMSDKNVLKYIKHSENKKELESKIKFLNSRKINLIYSDCNHEFLICNEKTTVNEEIFFSCFCPSCNAQINKNSKDKFFHERKIVHTNLSNDDISDIYNDMILDYTSEVEFIRAYFKFNEHIRDKESSERRKNLTRIK